MRAAAMFKKAFTVKETDLGMTKSSQSREIEGNSRIGAGSNARRLIVALVLTGVFLIAEIVGGLYFNSLALISDAAHMFTDVAALAVALVAIKIGQKPADDKRTFGYRRFEIIAAAFNAILLFIVAGYVLYEGVQRIARPEPVGTVGMLIVAVLGLMINLISMRILASGREASLNVKGAYLEVWADMLGSLGVIVAAGVIYATGWRWMDPVVAIAIGLWVLPRTWLLLRDTSNILLEGAPRGVDLKKIRKAIAATPGVRSMHELHVWVSGADQSSASVHVVTTDRSNLEVVRLAVEVLLMQRFGISHSTIQVETTPCDLAQTLHK